MWVKEDEVCVIAGGGGQGRTESCSAEMYRSVPRARQREFDLAVAACALTTGATRWTLNADDFRDIPGLDLFHG